jgi:hypothetical protein
MRTILRPFLFLETSASDKVKSLFAKTFKSLFLIFICISGFHSAASAQAGEALDYTGITNYVALPNLLPTGSSYTKEAWVNPSALGPFNGNIVSGNSSAFWAPNGFLTAGHSAGNTYTDVQDVTAMTIGTWYHVAVTYDAGTNTLTLYKNGVQVATGLATGTYTETTLYLGSFSATNSHWIGRIDEVRIWDVVRTGVEIANNTNCLLTGDEPSLLAYYDFNQGIAGGANPTETTLTDRSDRCNANDNNNGTLIGFTLTGATSNWVAPGAGIAGSCLGTFSNINVEGNTVCIPDDDSSPGLGDHTDFGIGNPVVRTFTIRNTGTATLNLTLPVLIGGTNASDFTVTAAPAASIAPAGTTTFNITFIPTANGVRDAFLTVINDDINEGSYDFSISGSFFTLPVNLKSFTIRKESGHAQLNWVTSAESNNRGFEIQRQKNGDNWITIGFVTGAGTSSSDQSYTYTDLTPQKGKNYYRLKQLDIDNKAKISEVRSVTFASEYTIVYPVPANDKIVIELKDTKLIGTRATLSDQQGRLIKVITITKMQQEVSLSALPPGFYMLKMDDGSVNKLVKQ